MKSFTTAKLKTQGKLDADSANKDEKEVDTKGKTYLQLLKEKRDYKRRRQKYRARNVHITRKTPTEVRNMKLLTGGHFYTLDIPYYHWEPHGRASSSSDDW